MYEAAEAEVEEVRVALVVVVIVVVVVVVVVAVVVVLRVVVVVVVVAVDGASDDDALRVLLTMRDDATEVGHAAVRDHSATDDEACAEDCCASSAATLAARADADAEAAAEADLTDDDEYAAALVELLRAALMKEMEACRLAVEAERVAEGEAEAREGEVEPTPTTAADCERVVGAAVSDSVVEIPDEVARDVVTELDDAPTSLNEMASSPVSSSPPRARNDASDMIV